MSQARLPDGQASPARVWLRLWRSLAGRDRRQLELALAAMIGSAVLKALLPVLIGTLVDRSLTSGGVTIGAVGPNVGLIAALVVGQQLLEVVRRQLVEAVSTSFDRDNRTRAYRHLLRLDFERLREERLGGLYGRADRSIEGTTKLLKLGAMDLLPALITAVAALAVAFGKSVEVAIAMSFAVPTGFAIVRWQVRNQAGVRLEVRDCKEQIDGEVVELLPTVEAVRACGAEGYFTDRVRHGCDRLRETELRHHRAMSLFDAAKFLNEGLWLVVVLWVALNVAGGTGSAGDVMTFALLFFGVLTPLRELHRIIDEASESSLQARDFLALLDEPEDEGFRALRANRAAAGHHPAVRIAGLRFGYAQSARRVIDGLDVEVQGGERVGVVGESGCGKTTLLRLIRRFHHDYEGRIELGGRDLRSFTHDELAGVVGYVPQSPQIIYGTIADNIRFGLAGATDAQVVEAARQAHLEADVLRLPAGYDSIVGERGETLSGGQRQRVCIARALLRSPLVLLLDEPTSQLDPISERAVQRAIDGIEGVAVIVIAHRIETLRRTDRVIVLDSGRIVEEDGFEDLAKAGGLFASMLGQGVKPPRAA